MNHHAFISYCKEDLAEAHEIATALKDKYRLDVWFAEWNILPGDSWQHRIEEGLENSAAVVAIIGSSGFTRWMEKEVRSFIADGDDAAHVIPVLLPSAPEGFKLPRLLRAFSVLDVRAVSLEVAITRLYAALSTLAPQSQCETAGVAVAEIPAKVRYDTGSGSPGTASMPLDLLRMAPTIDVEPAALGAAFVSNDVVVDSVLRGVSGCRPDELDCELVGSVDAIGFLPEYVVYERSRQATPVPNRSKLFLIGWDPPVLDQGDGIRLRVADGDYLTSESIRETSTVTHELVRGGLVDMDTFPRRLDVHVLVVTSFDNQMILSRRGAHLATQPATWMCTVGESMDASVDVNDDGKVEIDRVVRRCLSERDELNLPGSTLEGASMRVIALATEWHELLANLICIVTLDADVEHIVKSFIRGENDRLTSVEFNPRQVLHLLATDVMQQGATRRQVRLNPISRVAALLALFSEFGDRAVLNELDRVVATSGRQS